MSGEGGREQLRARFLLLPGRPGSPPLPAARSPAEGTRLAVPGLCRFPGAVGSEAPFLAEERASRPHSSVLLTASVRTLGDECQKRLNGDLERHRSL